MLAPVRLREDAYSRAIRREVEARLARDVSAGAVHTTLVRLERKGLLGSDLGSGTPIRAGRPRRFYRLQPDGLRALNQTHATVDGRGRGLKWPLKGFA